MRKSKLLLGFLILSLSACKTSPINQMIDKKREGYWIEKYTQDGSEYKSLGQYKNDDPIKKWRHYKDSKVVKKERYTGNSCSTRIYFENGKIQSKGKTVFDSSAKYDHWYYSGSWDFYNAKEKLIMKRFYDKGKLVSETKLKN